MGSVTKSIGPHVVEGTALALPSLSSLPTPGQEPPLGSLRYNPDAKRVEAYVPNRIGQNAWEAVTAGVQIPLPPPQEMPGDFSAFRVLTDDGTPQVPTHTFKNYPQTGMSTRVGSLDFSSMGILGLRIAPDEVISILPLRASSARFNDIDTRLLQAERATTGSLLIGPGSVSGTPELVLENVNTGNRWTIRHPLDGSLVLEHNGASAAVLSPTGTMTLSFLDGVAREAQMVPTMTGASAMSDGVSGSVPQPLILDEGKFLRGDGTWAIPQGAIIVADTASLSAITPDDGVVAHVLASGTAPQGETFIAASGAWIKLQASLTGPVAGIYTLANGNGETFDIDVRDGVSVDVGNTLTLGSDGLPHAAIFTGASASSDGVSGAVPQPLAGQETLFLRADGTWADATLVMVGATASSDGEEGVVPRPLMGDEDAVLVGGGFWNRVLRVGSSFVRIVSAGLTPLAELFRYGATTSATIVSNHARGTEGFENNTQVGDQIFAVDGAGYNGSAYETGARIAMIATDSHTTTERGTRVDLSATPKGTLNIRTALSTDGDGIHIQGGVCRAIQRVTTLYNITPNDDIIILANAVSGTVREVRLPEITTTRDGRTLTFIRNSSNDWDILTQGSDTIIWLDGTVKTRLVMPLTGVGSRVTLVASGSTWFAI